jgi:cytochrome c oxidase subunit 3
MPAAVLSENVGKTLPFDPDRRKPEKAPSGLLADPARLGLSLFLGTVTMLFVGFTSAMLVRRTGGDWIPITLPAAVWANTALLVLSSVTLELARRGARAERLSTARNFVAVTALLGLLFVTGQLVVWRQLAAAGVFLGSNPHSSFFYLLTGAHAVHLLAAVIWCAAVTRRVWRWASCPTGDPLGLIALFWHFLGGLWLYVLYVLLAL